MKKKTAQSHTHSAKDISSVISLFFALRGLMRTQFAQGKKLNPYAWLHIETMIFIREQNGPSMRAIADHLAITAPSATSLIGALVKGGLVRRAKDARDARASRIYLTKKGDGVLTKTQAQGPVLLAGIFAALSPRELTTFRALLERMLTTKESRW